MIPTRIHGVLDYIIGVALIAAPWLFGFAHEGAETWIPVVLGAGVILYSLLTNYELGLLKVIPMKVHLGIDVLGGLFLALSPWMFGYASLVWVPHVVVGVIMLGSGLMTEKVSPTERLTGRHS